MPGNGVKRLRSAEVAAQTVVDVLPRGVDVDVGSEGEITVLTVNGQPLRLGWAGRGDVREVRLLLAGLAGRVDVVVARALSPAARELLTGEGRGWADQRGAAEIAVGLVVVSREGRPPDAQGMTRWTPAVLSVAEALLCGTDATVAATRAATGLSAGSCTLALRLLADRRLLTANAERGPGSGRRVSDLDQLLDAYASAVDASKVGPALTVGIQGRDVVGALAQVGAFWSAKGISWAATGVVAAAVLAPLLTSVATAEAFVDANSIAGLEARASEAGLRPIEGGRLTLRRLPSVGVARLAEEHEGLCIAPWPRVYADLRRAGVRGEEAAEHLREVIHG